MEEYITSRKNPLIVETVKLLSSGKHRKALGLFAGEGDKLLPEAVHWAPQALRTVIACEGKELPELPAQVRCVRVPELLFRQISRMEEPEGVLFTMALPQPDPGAPVPGTLLLDGIQDPGNLGTILRTADAFCVPVMLLPGCADPYNPKTVRAAMGALFRSAPGKIGREDLLRQCRGRGIPCYAAAAAPGAVDVRLAPLRESAVVIGSEGQGVSEEIRRGADGQVAIPMQPRCESLNAAAAAAIILWQMAMPA